MSGDVAGDRLEIVVSSVSPEATVQLDVRVNGERTSSNVLAVPLSDWFPDAPAVGCLSDVAGIGVYWAVAEADYTPTVSHGGAVYVPPFVTEASGMKLFLGTVPVSAAQGLAEPGSDVIRPAIDVPGTDDPGVAACVASRDG